jgi:cell division protein FtsB
MMEKILTLLVGLLIALGGWSLSRTFELSTQQAIQTEKVDKLERHVEKLTDKMDVMKDKEEEIIEQHKKLFEVLDNREDTPSGYSYN